MRRERHANAGRITLALAILLFGLLPASPARASILDRLLPWFSNSIATKGLAIHFNGSLTATAVELKDTEGVYATFNKVRIDWDPFALIHGDIKVSSLTAKSGDLARLPKSSGGSSGGVKNLDLGKLDLEQFTLEKPVAGQRAVFDVTGSGHMHPAGMSGEVTAKRLDAEGDYHLDGSKEASGVKLLLAAHEAAGGLIATEAKLPDIGPIALNATIDGPESALATQLTLAAGELKAKADGTIDLTDHTIPALQVNASAPAMTPRPDLSWSSITVAAKAKGPFAAPDINADIKIAALKAGQAGARLIALSATGNEGDIKVNGAIDGLTVPGKAPDILAAAPVRLAAEAKLKAPQEPVSFALTHPLIQAEGQGSIKAERARMRLSLPDLTPFAAAEGEQLAGHAVLALDGGRQNGVITLAANGTVGITGGKAPVPALVGDNATLDLAAQIQGSTVHLTRLKVNARDMMLAANGTASQSSVDLQFQAGLPDVTPIEPKLAGRVDAQGRVNGAMTALALDTTIHGELAAQGQSSGPFTAHLVAQGLPSTPSGHLTAEGTLLSSPIDVALAGGRSPDGAIHVTIDQASWKSLSAGGTLLLPAGARLPQGDLTLRIGNLANFSPLVGKELSGSAEASLNATAEIWRLQASAENAAVPGTASLSAANLQLALDHPENNPLVNGDLILTGLKASKLAGSVRMAASGPTNALKLDANANLSNLDGAPAKLKTAGMANIPDRALRLDALSAAWRGQNARLLAPVSFDFAQGVTINNLRLGLRQAVLRVNGHVGKTLDLTASAANIPASLAALVSPRLDLAGTLNADARITGTSSAPTGAIHARASGLRLLTGKAQALPPASITANVDLLGTAAKLDVAARAGASHLQVTGQTGLSTTASVNLRANGVLEAATVDALLPQGERAGGRITLAANVTGTAAKPNGTVRVDASGVRVLTGPAAGLPPVTLAATATVAGETARIDSHLRAGASYFTVAGTAGLVKNGPLDLRAAGTLDLAIANPILLASGEAAHGTLSLNTTIGGTLDNPRIAGGGTLANGDVHDYAAGVHLTNITARLSGDGETLRLLSMTARAGQGTMSAHGAVGVLQAGIPIDLVITARDATPISSDILTATFSSNLSITGQLENAVTLGGRVFVRQAVIQVPNKLPTSVVTIPVRIAGEPPPKPKPPSKLLATIAMNLTVAAPQQIFIRGRGLNAELGGTIHIGGTTTEMVPTGQFKLIRGTFNLVGTTLTFTSGSIAFNGASITNPGLDLVAMYTGSNLTATLTVGGTARDPKITLSSTPQLPQDEILAELLFHTNSGGLSPFQLASIAAGLAQISGQGGSLTNPLSGLQNALGLDQLGVTTGPNGQPVVQAGRYVTRGVFVGAEEATGGTGARAKVQIDLTKRLKLDATAGSGETTSAIGASGESTGASVGLTYQFQY